MFYLIIPSWFFFYHLTHKQFESTLKHNVMLILNAHKPAVWKDS